MSQFVWKQNLDAHASFKLSARPLARLCNSSVFRCQRKHDQPGCPMRAAGRPVSGLILRPGHDRFNKWRSSQTDCCDLDCTVLHAITPFRCADANDAIGMNGIGWSMSIRNGVPGAMSGESLLAQRNVLRKKWQHRCPENRETQTTMLNCRPNDAFSHADAPGRCCRGPRRFPLVAPHR